MSLVIARQSSLVDTSPFTLATIASGVSHARSHRNLRRPSVSSMLSRCPFSMLPILDFAALPFHTAIPRVRCSLLRSLPQNCSSASGHRYSRLSACGTLSILNPKRRRARQCKTIQDRISGYRDDASRLSSETLIAKINHESSVQRFVYCHGFNLFFHRPCGVRNSHNLS
jgi:hypothetical protein